MLGVATERFIITGDDAIDMAYKGRAPELGTAIGITLRVADYSEVGPDISALIGTCLQYATNNYSAPLIPVPISFHGTESDAVSIMRLL